MVREGLKRQAVARDPILQHIGRSGHRIQIKRVRRLRGLIGLALDDSDGQQGALPHTVDPVKLQVQGVVIHRRAIVKVDEIQLATRSGILHPVIQRGKNIIGGHGIPVVELNILSQVQGHTQIIVVQCEGLAEAWFIFALAVAGKQIVVNQAVVGHFVHAVDRVTTQTAGVTTCNNDNAVVFRPSTSTCSSLKTAPSEQKGRHGQTQN